MDAVTIYVDPLDGTREFVEGRLTNVQSLVGIAVGGRAVAGAIGLPFPGGVDSPPAVVYGLCFGDVKEVKTHGQRPAAEPWVDMGIAGRPVVVTGDDTAPVLVSARTAALGAKGTAIIKGAAGNKLLACGDSPPRADIAMMHLKTSLWDTCAPEAIIRARGGYVTDLFGSPIVYLPPTRPSDLTNSLGVIASSSDMRDTHEALTTALRRDPTALALLEQVCTPPGMRTYY